MKKGHITISSRRNEPFERMLKRFIKMVKKEKIVEEARERMYYEKPSAKKRRLKRRARAKQIN
jgi:small subunit ribosomal protein S21|tara:strand:- start:582 stop:770 length:189 start_codon:yes stop_codon:yes gene_type:complete